MPAWYAKFHRTDETMPEFKGSYVGTTQKPQEDEDDESGCILMYMGKREFNAILPETLTEEEATAKCQAFAETNKLKFKKVSKRNSMIILN